MHVCISMRVYIYIYICTCACVHVYVSVCSCMCASVGLRMCVHVCICRCCHERSPNARLRAVAWVKQTRSRATSSLKSDDFAQRAGNPLRHFAARCRWWLDLRLSRDRRRQASSKVCLLAVVAPFMCPKRAQLPHGHVPH